MRVNGRVVASVRRAIYIAIKSGLIFRVRLFKILELIVRRRNGRRPGIIDGRKYWRNGSLNRMEFWRNDLLGILSHGGTGVGRI